MKLLPATGTPVRLPSVATIPTRPYAQAQHPVDVVKFSQARVGHTSPQGNIALAKALYQDVLKRFPARYQPVAPKLTWVQNLPKPLQALMPKSHAGSYIPSLHRFVIRPDTLNNPYYAREAIAHEMHHGLKQLERWHLEATEPGSLNNAIKNYMLYNVGHGETQPLLFTGLEFNWNKLHKPHWEMNLAQMNAVQNNATQWVTQLIKHPGSIDTAEWVLTPKGEETLGKMVPGYIRELFPSPRPVVEYINLNLQAQGNNGTTPALIKPPAVPQRLQASFQRLATVAMENTHESLVPSTWDGDCLHPDYELALQHILQQHQIPPTHYPAYKAYLLSFPTRYATYASQTERHAAQHAELFKQLGRVPLPAEKKKGITQGNVPAFVQAYEGNLLSQHSKDAGARIAYLTSGEERHARQASDAHMVQYLKPQVKTLAARATATFNRKKNATYKQTTQALKAYTANQAYMKELAKFTQVYRKMIHLPQSNNALPEQRIEDQLARIPMAAEIRQQFHQTLEAMHQLYPSLSPERQLEMQAIERFHTRPHPPGERT